MRTSRYTDHLLRLVLVTGVLLLSGCIRDASYPASGREATPARSASHEAGGLAAAPAGSPLSENSLYHLAAVWTDQQGAQLALAGLRGRPVLISMVFTRCGYACPTIVRDMKRIGDALPQGMQNELRYVLVSLDPEHDTPEALAAFAQAHRLDPNRWTLLHGEPAGVQMLAALLGTRYKQEPGGGFSHSNLVTLLSREGDIVHQLEGLGRDPARLVSSIQELQSAL